MSTLSVGDRLPEFEMPLASGGAATNASYLGRKLVLYFYPRDDTPGCTKEAIGFTEHRQAFEDANAAILGVSKDPVPKHQKFVAKHNLGIELASDADGDFCERMGVWVEKNMYGKTYFGIERATFLVGADGTIHNIWRKVKVPGHVEEVLEQVNQS